METPAFRPMIVRRGREAAMATRRLASRVVLVLALMTGCGDDASFCTDLDDDPPSCEICSNNRDDDLDGDEDCDDSECDDTAFCRDDEEVR
jgi:hypothetical protein